MRFIFVSLILLFLNLNWNSVFAQVADSVQLPELIVIEDPFSVLSETSSTRLGRVSLDEKQFSITDILQQNTAFFMRNQGTGLLSTFSYNGFSPSQIRVEWNGLEMNHPMLGLIDAAIIPSEFTDHVDFSASFVPTGSGSLAMGGIVSFHSTFKPIPFSYSQTISTLENHQFSSTIPIGKSKSLKLIYQNNQNHYSYYDPVFSMNQIRKYNSSDTEALFYQQQQVIVGKPIHTTVWVQRTRREIPGPIGVVQNPANQTDAWIRVSNYLNMNNGKNPWKIQHNLAFEKLDFLDSALVHFGSDPLSWSNTYRNQIRSVNRMYLSEQVQLDFTFDRTDNWIHTNNYESIKYRGISKFISSNQFQILKQISVSFIAQLEHYSDFGFAVSPLFGVNYQIENTGIVLFSNWSRSYAPPTFNDLYWPQQGNSELKPQSALKWETGYKWMNKINRLEVVHDSYFLWAKTQNGIQWMPENGIWKPFNVTETEHQVFNSHTILRLLFNHWTLDTGTDINVNQVVNSKTPNGDVGKQLMYVPLYQLKGWIALKWNNSEMSSSFQRIGKRFINSSNTQYLIPFEVIDLNLSYQKGISFARIISQISIQNLLNQEYEVMRLYPMPGRIYQFTFKFLINS